MQLISFFVLKKVNTSHFTNINERKMIGNTISISNLLNLTFFNKVHVP